MALKGFGRPGLAVADALLWQTITSNAVTAMAAGPPKRNPLDPSSLIEILQRPNPLEAAARADALRRELHGTVTSFTLVQSIDLGSALSCNPINGIPLGACSGGEEGPEGAASLGDRARLVARVQACAHPAAGDYQLLPPEGTGAAALLEIAAAAAEAIDSILEQAGRPASSTAGGGSEPGGPTFQLGVADTWMQAGADRSVLSDARAAGLRVISDGVRPQWHPAFGEEAHRRWAAFWTDAGRAGLRGNAAVLFGPELPLDRLLDQLRAIAAVQEESGVFLSLSPMVYDPKGFGGARDALLTQGQFDVRVFSACRLWDTGVEHVRMSYGRSDLKMAHLSLSCGVDDLEGPLSAGERSPREVADSFDLSGEEMIRWLEEVGYTPVLRNGAFDLQPEELDEA